MREITPGLRYWTAPHPEWRGAADWPEEVGCVYYEAPDATVLIDPLIPKSDEDELWATLDAFVERLGLPVAVLLTAPWHARSASEIAERYGSGVWIHQSDAAELPSGVEVFVPGGVSEGQVAFLLRPPRALVVAEIFMGVNGGGLRVCPSPACSDDEALDFRRSLRTLLDLPIDHVLVSHGEPVINEGRSRIAEALGIDA
jgi:glyoxylase-like metal-dependent hydrolase (beta-lactamase superfamily II)